MRLFRKHSHQLSPLRCSRILLGICVSALCIVGLKSFVQSVPEEALARENAVTKPIIAQPASKQPANWEAAERADLADKSNDLLDDAQYPGLIEETTTVKRDDRDSRRVRTRQPPSDGNAGGIMGNVRRPDLVVKETLSADQVRFMENPNSIGTLRVEPVRPFVPVNRRQLPQVTVQMPFNPINNLIMPLEPANQNPNLIDYTSVGVGQAVQGSVLSHAQSVPQTIPPHLLFLPTTSPPRLTIDQRIVHFDLKGAPLKLEYYKRIFPLLKKLGATGLLMEYEDMFPFSGKLKKAQAKNAYTRDNILQITRLAAENDLEIIPLIQTFGHLEFILKHHQFSNLREVPNFPQAVCPSRNGSFDMVKDIIDQVVEMHPNSTFLHIGADEVFQLGVCPICASRIANNPVNGKNEIFLSYVAQLLTYIRAKYPHLRPIMWDDMFHSMTSDSIKQGLGTLTNYVEVMIWSYFQDWTRHLPMNGDLYANVFSNFWGATAFKGSDGETRQIPDIKIHSQIHTSWLEALAYTGSKMKNFRGIVLTGWSRYDHFYPLCELFPVSLPSLAINMQILVEGAFTLEGSMKAANILGCSVVPNSLNFITFDPTLSQFMHCNFPGVEVFRVVHLVDGIRNVVHSFIDELEGKYPEYQLREGYIQPSRIEEIMARLWNHDQALRSYVPMAQAAFATVFDEYTLNEWIAAQIQPSLKKLEFWRAVFIKAWPRKEWAARPLEISVKDLQTASTLSSFGTVGLQSFPPASQSIPNVPQSN